MSCNDSAPFVQAALLEAGYVDVAPAIRTSPPGGPVFHWHTMGRLPSWDEVDAVLRAYVLWYRAFDPDVPFTRHPGDVDEWLDQIGSLAEDGSAFDDQ